MSDPGQAALEELSPLIQRASARNLDAADCLAFEDSDVGVRSAEGAGVAVIRVVF